MNKGNSKGKEKKSKDKQKENTNKEDYFAEDTYKYVEEIKNKKFEYGVVAGIVILVLASFYFQHRYEKTLRMSTGDDSDTNHYDILGVDYSIDVKGLKKRYKELAKVWHPDKNPNCTSCHEKFGQISKSYEVLIQETEGGEKKSIFNSNPTYLTVKNYHKLVEESNDYWIICVYEKTRTNGFNKHVADIFDEVHSKYKNLVRFGVIDVTNDDNLLHFLPYKFQYFPNIFTYLHGEESELYGNWDSFSVKTLIQFVEDSFVSKAQIIDDYALKYLVDDTNKRDVTGKVLSFADLETSAFILSGKSYVDIAVKDFAKNYQNSIQISQNQMSSFDQCKKLLPDSEDYRIFVRHNTIVEEDGKVYLKPVIKPVPISFNYKNKIGLNQKLQKSFNIVKSMALHTLYKNNYSKHCINKMMVNGEELKEENEENETRLNLCVVALDHKFDLQNKDINKEFMKILIGNFNKHSVHENGQKKSEGEDYIIKVNYAKMVLESNAELMKLYNRYHTEKSISTDINKNKKLFLIINDTNEKFMFKSFDDAERLSEFFTDLDSSDAFEDLALSFDYFSNYEVRDILQIFNEEKIVSITKIISSVFNSQMQATYVFSYILIAIINNFVLKKYETLKLLGICFAISIVGNFLFQLYFQLF